MASPAAAAAAPEPAASALPTVDCAVANRDALLAVPRGARSKGCGPGVPVTAKARYWGEAWAKKEYGKNWTSARVSGIINKPTGRGVFEVAWDDGQLTTMTTDNINIDHARIARLLNGTDGIETDDKTDDDGDPDVPDIQIEEDEDSDEEDPSTDEDGNLDEEDGMPELGDKFEWEKTPEP